MTYAVEVKRLMDNDEDKLRGFEINTRKIIGLKKFLMESIRSLKLKKNKSFIINSNATVRGKRARARKIT